MEFSFCWTPPIPLTPSQLPTYQISLISLLLLPLCTFILQYILSPSSQTANPSQPPQRLARNTLPSFPHFAIASLAFFTWIAALISWCFSLAEISPVLRNNSLIYGILAANLGVLYELFGKWMGRNGNGEGAGGSGLERLIGFMLWPFYAGLLVGTLGFGSFGGEM